MIKPQLPQKILLKRWLKSGLQLFWLFCESISPIVNRFHQHFMDNFFTKLLIVIISNERAVHKGW